MATACKWRFNPRDGKSGVFPIIWIPTSISAGQRVNEKVLQKLKFQPKSGGKPVCQPQGLNILSLL